MFYTMLKERVTDNYQRTGGFPGLLSFLLYLAVLIVPPLVVLEIMDVPAFTVMRLIIPGVWVAYLVPGSRRLPERLRPADVLRLVVWPLLKA